MHFKEKTEQRHKLGSSADVISTLKKIIGREQDDEGRAIYSSGPYKLSNEYNKFSIDNLKWHSMTSEERKKTRVSVQKLQPVLRRQVYKASQKWHETLTSNSQKKVRARGTD